MGPECERQNHCSHSLEDKRTRHDQFHQTGDPASGLLIQRFLREFLLGKRNILAEKHMQENSERGVSDTPNWMRMAKTVLPNTLSVSMIDTGVSPVTQTALTERNSASKYEREAPLHERRGD